MVSTRSLLGLAVALLIAAPACAATPPPTTAPPTTARTPARPPSTPWTGPSTAVARGRRVARRRAARSSFPPTTTAASPAAAWTSRPRRSSCGANPGRNGWSPGRRRSDLHRRWRRRADPGVRPCDPAADRDLRDRARRACHRPRRDRHRRRVRHRRRPSGAVAPHPGAGRRGPRHPGGHPRHPEIAVHGYDNLNGIVAMSDRRLIVGHRADGLLYRIDLDATGGRTIVPITGTTVPLSAGMALNGNRLVVSDAVGIRWSRSTTTPGTPRWSSRSATRRSATSSPWWSLTTATWSSTSRMRGRHRTRSPVCRRDAEHPLASCASPSQAKSDRQMMFGCVATGSGTDPPVIMGLLKSQDRQESPRLCSQHPSSSRCGSSSLP